MEEGAAMKTIPGNIVAKYSFDKDVMMLLNRYTAAETKAERDDICREVARIIGPYEMDECMYAIDQTER